MSKASAVKWMNDNHQRFINGYAEAMAMKNKLYAKANARIKELRASFDTKDAHILATVKLAGTSYQIRYDKVSIISEAYETDKKYCEDILRTCRQDARQRLREIEAEFMLNGTNPAMIEELKKYVGV